MIPDDISDEEVARLRAAGVAVPETLEEARAMLEAGEASGEPIDADLMFLNLRRKLVQQYPELRESA